MSLTRASHWRYLPWDAAGGGAPWAEEVAQEAGIPAEIIPAPPAAQARCNLALETLPEEVEHLADTLAAQGVPHGRWSPPD
jgi:hypothetical protein